MIKITFKRPQAADAFISMAEGMWENRRDDAVEDDTRAQEELALWTELLDLLGKPTRDFDHSWVLDDKFRPLVEDVRDNCDDNAHDMGINNEHDLAEANDEDREMACCSFELTIETV